MTSRLLGLSLGVAALAVGAVALLDGPPRARPATDRSLLETDGEIHAALATYANEHRDWSGVDALVRELAQRTGRRVALAAPDGEPIADSALLLGTGSAERPEQPAARIDATELPSPELTLDPTIVVREPDLGVDYAVYVFQLTETERRQRQALADEALECVRGKETVRQAASRRHRRAGVGTSGAPPGMPCMPPAVHAPSSAGRALRERTVELTTACLDAHRVAYEVTTAPTGMPSVRPATEGPLWTECAENARVEAKRAFVAEPADLFIGDPPQSEPPWPALAAGAILLAACAVLAGRRLVRPDTVARPAIDDLVGDVAHELRTPLANVRSVLEAAQDGVLPLDTELVESLIEESELLERLVADLQDLALADAGMLAVHPEERDAVEAAEAVLSANRARSSEVDIQLVAPEPVTVHADPARLRQVLGNLVSNAVRHTPPGGRVVVSVRRRAGEAVLTVADTGPGIGPEHLPRVFERFYRAGATTGGTGLGLAIARHLVTAHGGVIEVSSVPGRGATFTVRLPRVRGKRPPAPGTGGETGGASTRGRGRP